MSSLTPERHLVGLQDGTKGITTFFNTGVQLLRRHPAIFELIQLASAGILFKVAEELGWRIWRACQDVFITRVDVQDKDDAYDWLHHFVSVHAVASALHEPNSTGIISLTRKFDIQSRSFWPISFAQSLIQRIGRLVFPWRDGPPQRARFAVSKPREEWEYDDDETALVGADGEMGLSMVPQEDYAYRITWQGNTFTFMLRKEDVGGNTRRYIEMSSPFASHAAFVALLCHARDLDTNATHSLLAIYTPQDQDSWKRTISRPTRPWSSVFLEKRLKAAILEDAKSFFDQKTFYRQRGIPWRRGYLLHGPPGTGKTSLISALAGILELDIYSINLSSKMLDDSSLQVLLNNVPERCILLLEDIDCAFKSRSKTAPLPETDVSKTDAENDDGGDNGDSDREPTASMGITLSGLLNALDGIASSEGRLLFCTTNHVENIDPALCRPGRCDVWIEFSLATFEQAKDLFMSFYSPISGGDLEPPSPTEDKTIAFGGLPFDRIQELAEEFASTVQDTVTVSALQAYLLVHKFRPEAAVRDVPSWSDEGFKPGQLVLAPV